MWSFSKTVRVVSVLTPFLACASPSIPPTPSDSVQTTSSFAKVTETGHLTSEIQSSPIDFADAKLKEIGFNHEFIQKIHVLYLDQHHHSNHHRRKSLNWEESASKIIALNVFGFLYPAANYQDHDSPVAVRKIRRYLKDHRKSFLEIRKKIPVSSDAIASLLWVETKNGKSVGTFPLPFVFYSLVMAAHPQFINKMLESLPEQISKNNPKNLSMEVAQSKVIERCKAKSEWAAQELKAILKILKNKDFDPYRYPASFAGAFGFAQFIPSTYLKHAVSEFRSSPNLFKHSDAIASVANFLLFYGWKDDDITTQEVSLFNYNHSKDYTNVILQLAREVSR